MTNISNPLVDEIISEARKKADEIIRQAEAKAAAMLNEADEQAAVQVEAEHRLLLEKLERIEGKEESAKRNIDRLAELKCMDSAYKAVMENVRERFSVMSSSPEFQDVLVRWIAEAALGLGRKEAKVAFSASSPVSENELRKAEKLVHDMAGADVVLSIDPVRIDGIGVVLTSLDGKISYNNQLDTRLRRFQRDIRKIIQEENAGQNCR